VRRRFFHPTSVFNHKLFELLENGVAKSSRFLKDLVAKIGLLVFIISEDLLALQRAILGCEK